MGEYKVKTLPLKEKEMKEIENNPLYFEPLISPKYLFLQDPPLSSLIPKLLEEILGKDYEKIGIEEILLVPLMKENEDLRVSGVVYVPTQEVERGRGAAYSIKWVSKPLHIIGRVYRLFIKKGDV